MLLSSCSTSALSLCSSTRAHVRVLCHPRRACLPSFLSVPRRSRSARACRARCAQIHGDRSWMLACAQASRGAPRLLSPFTRGRSPAHRRASTRACRLRLRALYVSTLSCPNAPVFPRRAKCEMRNARRYLARRGERAGAGSFCPRARDACHALELLTATAPVPAGCERPCASAHSTGTGAPVLFGHSVQVLCGVRRATKSRGAFSCPRDGSRLGTLYKDNARRGARGPPPWARGDTRRRPARLEER